MSKLFKSIAAGTLFASLLLLPLSFNSLEAHGGRGGRGGGRGGFSRGGDFGGGGGFRGGRDYHSGGGEYHGGGSYHGGGYHNGYNDHHDHHDHYDHHDDWHGGYGYGYGEPWGYGVGAGIGIGLGLGYADGYYSNNNYPYTTTPSSNVYQTYYVDDGTTEYSNGTSTGTYTYPSNSNYSSGYSN